MKCEALATTSSGFVDSQLLLFKFSTKREFTLLSIMWLLVSVL